MEDVKWLLRRCGLPILLLLIFVIAGVFCWRKLHAEKQKVAEEVWEPPIEIENSEAETEEAENAEISTESAYWFIPQASDDLLSEKEKEQLSYVNYNVLVTNWDSSNVEDILMPCMYEDIYRISTGENLKTEDWKIPAEEYERIMTTYFPVSVEQLREHCGYAEGSNSYEYEMIYASPYPPFGEVVDYTKNADGTITLIVDGVWPDYNSDLAFRNTVVVLPFEDGTFRYLSNSIEQIELELPPIARKKG